jgi:mono/diheme cytochrome c family protein
MDESFVINDGGTLRTQLWHYPSRAECLACHTAQGGYTLGFNTPQLNRNINYSGFVTNQLTALNEAGYFSSPVSGFHTFPALAAATNTVASLEYRVRSYLAATCVQCHQPGGSAGWSLWDARLSTPTSQAGIINGALVDNLGDTNNAVIKPGALGNSVMLARIANLGQDHMPPLATSLINTQAVQLLSDWITNDLPGYLDFNDWQLAYFGTTNGPIVAATGDYDGDGAVNFLEYLTGTNPTNALSHWSFNLALTGGVDTVSFLQVANRGFEVQSTTNLVAPIVWTPLDLPGNEPFFWITNHAGMVQDTPNTITKYYRIRVFEP